MTPRRRELITKKIGVGVLGNLDQEGKVELETDRELEQQLVNTVQPLPKNNNKNYNFLTSQQLIAAFTQHKEQK